MTAILKPFRNPEDSWLALASQAILVFAYSCCALLRVLDAQWLTDDIKQKLIGFTNPTGVFTALAICFVLFLFFVLATCVRAISEPSILRVSSDALFVTHRLCVASKSNELNLYVVLTQASACLHAPDICTRSTKSLASKSAKWTRKMLERFRCGLSREPDSEA